MSKDIRVLLVDDHQVVREGLRHMLAQAEDIKIVGQGANSEEALAQLAALSPNITLMDIKMAGMDGIALTRLVKQKSPACKVIMLTLYDEYLTQAMEAGAAGYLLKDIQWEELAQAIRRVHQGEIVIGESINHKAQVEYEKKTAEKVAEGPDTLFEEVQLILPPPVAADQLLRLASQVEEMLQSRVLQVVGSWQEGTAMTLILTNAKPLADILNRLGIIPGIGIVTEKPLTEAAHPNLLKKANATPRLQNRARKTLLVSLCQSPPVQVSAASSASL